MPSPANPPSPLGPPRVRAFFAFLLASFFALVLLPRVPWVQARLARIVETQVAKELGLSVVIGAVELDPLRQRLTVRGLSLRGRDATGLPTPVILTVEEVSADLTLRAGRPSLGTLRVAHPLIRLRLDELGQPLDLAGLDLTRLMAEDSASPSLRFPWERLEIHHAAAQVDHPLGQLRLEDLSLNPEEGRPELFRLDIGFLQASSKDFVETARDLHLRDIDWRPDRVSIPNLDLPFDDLSLRGEFSAVRDGALGGDLRLEVRLPGLSPLVAPDAALEGDLQLDLQLSGTTTAPQLGGRLHTQDAAILQRDPLTSQWIRKSTGRIETPFQFDGRALAIGPLDAAWADGTLLIEAGLDVYSTGFWVQIDAKDLSLVQALASTGVHEHAWVELRTDLQGVAAGTLDPLRISGTVDLDIRDLEVDEGPHDTPGVARILHMPRLDLFAQLDVQADHFRISARELSTPRSRAEVDALIILGDPADLDIRIDLPRLDLAEIAPLGDLGLMGLATGKATLQGPADRLRLQGTLDATNFEMIEVPWADSIHTEITATDLSYLQFQEIRAHRGASDYFGHVFVDFRPAELELELLASTDRGRLSDFVGMFIEIPGLDAESSGSLSLKGPVDRFDGTAQFGFAQADVFGEAFPSGDAEARMVGGRFYLDRFRLWRQEGAEGLLVRGTVGDAWAANFDVQSGGFRLERMNLLQGLNLWGDVDLSGRVGGTLFAPEPHGNLRIQRAAIGRREVGDSLISFSSSEGVLRFGGNLLGDELAGQGTLTLDAKADWTVAADLRAFPAHVFYPQAPDGTQVRSTLTGHFEGAGALGDAIPTALFDLTLDQVELAWENHLLRNDKTWWLHWDAGAFTVEGVGLQGGNTNLSFGGRGDRRGDLDLSGGGNFDLDLLRMVAPGLRRSAGDATVTLMVEGPAGAARPSFRVDFQNGSFLTDFFPQPFEEVAAELRASPLGFEVVSAQGRLGGGTWTAGGRIDAESWAPTRFDLHGDFADARVRYLDFLPPVVGDASLRFDGPVSDLLLSGQVTVDEMLFAERIDWEDWLLQFSGDHLAGAAEDEAGDYFALDLVVDADRSIRMRNNVGDLQASANLRFVGDTSRTGMMGDIRAVPGGRVYLKEREFEISRAELHFTEPFSFNPELDIALNTRVRAREEEYTVDYRVGGPWSDWHTSTTSDPALPQADINSLLLFGMTSSELERYGGAAGALAVEGGDLLASKFGLVERVGERIYGLEFIRPERIDLVSGINERGSGTVSSDLRLLMEDDLDWGTLIFEQNLSRSTDTYLAFEKRLARKLYTRAYWSREQVGRRLDIGGAYGLEFNVRWEFN